MPDTPKTMQRPDVEGIRDALAGGIAPDGVMARTYIYALLAFIEHLEADQSGFSSNLPRNAQADQGRREAGERAESAGATGWQPPENDRFEAGARRAKKSTLLAAATAFEELINYTFTPGTPLKGYRLSGFARRMGEHATAIRETAHDLDTEPSPPLPGPTSAHDWDDGTRFGFPVCKLCGYVRRTDDKNSPCKGPIAIALREPGPTGADRPQDTKGE